MPKDEISEARIPKPTISEAYRVIATSGTSEYIRLFIIAMLLITAAAFLLSAELSSSNSLLHHIPRDIGIAALVAALIAVYYETYARLRFESALLNGFLGAVISDWSREDIWTTVKAQVIEKQVFRQNLRLVIQLCPAKALAERGQMLMKINVEYELCGLRSTSTEAQIAHFLDVHLKNKEENLPRFKSIQIDGKDIPIRDDTIDEKGRFIRTLSVPAKGRPGRKVSTERYEIIYIPGNHSFTMNEIAKGIELCMSGDIPPNLTVAAVIRPDPSTENIEFTEASGAHFHDPNLVLLPGQTIEFIFRRKEDVDET